VSLTIVQVSSPADIAKVRELLTEYTAWTTSVEGDAHNAPTFRGLEDELATLPGIYVPPAARLFLATVDGHPAGCIALKRHDDETCELKRLYVRPAFRGHQLGRRLVNLVLDAARDVGYERIILDSHISMKPAHEIYLAAGFRFVAPPANFPDRFRPVVVFMERDVPDPVRAPV
jgi:GNAT superfamily N-acetyltransferase